MLSDLGLNIGTAAYHRQEEDLYFAVAVALADEFLTVSYHEDAETMPSPYVEEVLRLFTPGAVKKEKYSVGDIFPQDYTAIFSGRELTGRLLLDGFGRAAPDGFIQQLGLPGWSAGDFAGRETGGGELEATSAAACAEPAGQETFSISALEDYALCPFSYYAKRILKLAEWAEKEEETGFDVVGTIYHEVLASFLRAHAGQKLQAGRGGEYGQELAAAVEASSQRLIDGHKIVPGKLWDYQRRRLEKNLDRWLEFEIAEQNAEGLAFTPQFFEWGFGLPQSAGMDARSVASPLELSVDGEVINIVGKVDRIDAAGDKLAVVDYKRKTCPPFRQLAQGLDLQAALYIMAVERFLCQGDGQVAGGGYYSVEARKKEGGMWRDELADEIVHRKAKRDGNLSAVEWEELQEKVRQQVGRCVAGIRAGNFPVAPAGDCPPYCIASGICRYLKGQAGGTIDD